MSECFCKTDGGRREIRERTHSLSRTTRTLLLILDGTRSGDAWVSMVKGASLADLGLLLDKGLVEVWRAVGSFSPAPVAQGQPPVQALAPIAPALPRVAVVPSAPPPPLLTASSLSYEALYGSLNALVKEQLGLMKGYRVSLQIERASNLAELVQVAIHLVDEVRQAKGEDAAQMVRRALSLS